MVQPDRVVAPWRPPLQVSYLCPTHSLTPEIVQEKALLDLVHFINASEYLWFSQNSEKYKQNHIGHFVNKSMLF